MRPDRRTYEAWLLDRMEGLLSPAREKALDAFLQDNPDLHAEHGVLPTVKTDGAEFPWKDDLRKAFPPTGAPDAAHLDDFLVARSEQDLSPEQEKQLDHYLYEHPGAGRNAALMARTKVHEKEIAYPGKETLQRHFPPKGMPDLHRLTDFLIADLEGDLSTEQRSALKHLISADGEAAREQRLVAATRAIPVALRFAGKEGLKKRGARVVALWPRLVAAACVLLLLGAGWWQLRNKPADGVEVARVEKSAVRQEARSTGRDARPIAPEDVTVYTSEQIAPKAQRTRPLEDQAAAASSATAKTHRPAPVTAPPPAEEREPRAVPVKDPVQDDLPMEGPALAHQVEEADAPPVAPERAEVAAAPREENTATAPPHGQGTSQDLGTYMANALRGNVLETPSRKTGLDDRDVLALADKAIGMVTGGHGGVHVEHSPEGQRFQLRLGRNFSVSGRRGR